MEIDFSLVGAQVVLVKPLPPITSNEQMDFFARVVVGDVGTIRLVRLSSTAFPEPLAVFDNGFCKVWVAAEHIGPLPDPLTA